MKVIFWKRGTLFRNKKKIAALFLCFSAAIIFYVVLSGRSGSEDPQAASVIRAVQTDQKVYSLVAVLDGSEDTADLRLLISVCRGLGIKPTVFTDPDALSLGAEDLKLLKENACIGLNGAALHALGYQRHLKLLTQKNDAIFQRLGQFPRFIRVEADAKENLLSAAGASGQYAVRESGALNGADSATISNGGIYSIGRIDENCAYRVAEAVSAAAAGGLACVSLEKLIFEYGGVSYG